MSTNDNHAEAHPADSIFVDRLTFDAAVKEIRDQFSKSQAWLDHWFETEPTNEQWNAAFAAYLQDAIRKITGDPLHYAFGRVGNFDNHLKAAAPLLTPAANEGGGR